MQDELFATTRMVMEPRDEAVRRGLLRGVERAAGELARLAALDRFDRAVVAELDRRFRSRQIPDREILENLHLPPWLGVRGETAADVIGLDDAA